MCTKTSPWSYGIIAILLVVFVSLSTVRADNPPWPSLVSVIALDPDAAEQGSDTATFLVVRIGPANTALTVQYALGGDALNGADYQSLSGTVTIPEGAHFAPVTVTPIDDYEIEGSESVVIALQQPPDWPPPYIVTWPSLALAEIADNDRQPTNHPPVVHITHPPDGAVFDGGDDISLVARSFDRDGRVLTVEFFAGTNSLGIVTNRPLHASVNSDLSMHADVDPVFELDADAFLGADVTVEKIPRGQLFRLVWSNAPPGHHVLTAVATDNDGATKQSDPVNITVLDQPPVPVVSARAPDPIAAEPDPATDYLDTGTFAIHRKGPTNESLRVFYRLGGTASNGVDYVELPHSVEIPAGERVVKVLVEPLDDSLVEGPEKVMLSLVPSPAMDAASPLPGDYRVGRAHTACVVIRDNDTPPNQPPLVRLVQPDDGDVFIAPANVRLVALARDFDGFVTRVEFFEGTNSLGTVTNHPTADSATRPAYSLMWSNVPPGDYVLSAVATDNQGATTASRPVEIKVVPRVMPPEVNITTVDPIASEPGVLTVLDPAVFAVTRSGNTNHPLNVFYSIHGTAANGVDYQLLSGRVEIPAGASSNRIMVVALGDVLVEGTESVVLKLQPHPLNGPDDSRPWWYHIGSNHVARAFILDNDSYPTNQPPKVALVHPDDGETFVAPADVQLVARAHDLDGWVRTVEFFEGENSLGVITNPPPTLLNLVNDAPEFLFQLKWEGVPPGEYVLTALATDNRGASSRSEPVRIRVVHPRPPVVTIHATDPYASEGYWIEPLPEPMSLDAERPIPFPIHPRSAVFTVFRHGNTNHDLVVWYKLDGTAENGVDYQELSGEVKIPAGSHRALIVVHPIDDDLPEPTETVVTRLIPPVCIAIHPPPLDCYVVGDPDAAKAVIFDNDRNQSPQLEIAHPSNGDVFRAGADIEIEVVTRDPDGWVATMEFFANEEKIGEQTIHFIIAPPPGEVQKFSMTWEDVPAGEYVLTARATDDQGAMALSDPVKILVAPALPLPVVTIHAIDPIATEPNPFTDGLPDTARLRVSRTGDDLTTALTVQYRVGGTASNGVDYVALSGVVTIPANAMSAPIEIDPLDDNLVEGTESVILTLIQPPCLTSNTAAADCYLVGEPRRAIAYIRDNDSPPKPPTVAIVSPANGSVYCAPVDLRLVAAADDADGWVVTVEFFAGTNSLGVVSNHVTIVDATLDRLPELGFGVVTEHSLQLPFSLVWSNVPPGKHILTAVATDNTGTTTRSRPVEISVREPHELPLVQIMTVDAIAREAATNTAAFRVRRAGPTNTDLTVYYTIHGTANNGADYLLLPGTVTIPAGRRTARIVVTPINDFLSERAETVILRLTHSPGTATYELGRPRVAAAVILDNDCHLDGPETFPDGSLHLRLAAQAGLQLRVESSTNLVDWEAEASFTTHAEATSFIDAERPNYSQRFFRIVPEYGELDAEE